MVLQELLQLGESYHQEFKETIDKSLVREVCAFANASGGKIFIGVSDDGRIKGVDFDNNTRSRLQDSINNIEPAINVTIDYQQSVIVLTIPESKTKPHACGDGFFLRIGPNSQKLSRNQIIEFFQQEGLVHFDELINPLVKFDKHFSLAKYNNFIELAKISPKLAPLEILQNLRCVNDHQQLTNAGALFFCESIEFLILQAKIACVLFQGTENITILDRKDYNADLISDIEDSIIFLRKHLNVAYKIEHIQREEILEIPEVALREAVINAVCHRNYFEKGANIVIAIFADRVEISNPGGLPSGLSKESFGHKSVTRNPLIADLLHRIGYIEKIGTGIKRIRDAVAETTNCSVEFKIDEHWFTTVFYRNKAQQAMSSDISSDITSVKILELLKVTPTLSARQLSEVLHISTRAIEKHLSNLKAANKIRREGSKKYGYWTIND